MTLEAGFRDVRNQGVLLRGVNTAPNDLLELCFMLLDHAKIMPYYFYMCDMIPNAEHWRTSVAEAQDLQYELLGYMPGFATPRVVCDVPFVGKRWVHMLKDYDRTKGISYWTKNYRTGIEDDDPDALTRQYPYYDPIYTLPEEGQQWWREQRGPRAPPPPLCLFFLLGAEENQASCPFPRVFGCEFSADVLRGGSRGRSRWPVFRVGRGPGGRAPPHSLPRGFHRIWYVVGGGGGCFVR